MCSGPSLYGLHQLFNTSKGLAFGLAVLTNIFIGDDKEKTLSFDTTTLSTQQAPGIDNKSIEETTQIVKDGKRSDRLPEPGIETRILMRRKDKRAHLSMDPLYLVRLAGIEPTTPWFVAKYSIQLSYSRERQNYSSLFRMRQNYYYESDAAINQPKTTGMTCMPSNNFTAPDNDINDGIRKTPITHLLPSPCNVIPEFPASNKKGADTKRQKGPSFDGPFISGAAGRNRTHDPLVRSQVLYPAELQPRKTRL